MDARLHSGDRAERLGGMRPFTSPPAPRGAPHLQRLELLDAVRAAAVVLALSTHAASTFVIWPVLGWKLSSLFRLVTMAGTPLFLVTFGATFEYVAWPRRSRDGARIAAARLRHRGVECYAAYVLTLLAGVVGGHRTVTEGVAALLFLSHTHFGNILKFYVIELWLGGALLFARARLGLRGMVALAAVLWMLPSLVAALGWWPPVPDALANLTALMVGHPALESPPSLLHGQVLVVAGMLFGHALTEDRAGRRWERVVPYLVGAILVGALVLATVLLLELSPREFLRLHVQRVLRSENHIGYYAISLVEASMVMLLLVPALPPGTRLHGVAHRLLALGRWPLLSYTAGNVVLNLWPMWVPLGGFGRVAAVALFPLGIAAFAAAWEDRAETRQRA